MEDERHDATLRLESVVLGPTLKQQRLESGGEWEAAAVLILGGAGLLEPHNADGEVYLSPLERKDLTLHSPSREVGEFDDGT